MGWKGQKKTALYGGRNAVRWLSLIKLSFKKKVFRAKVCSRLQTATNDYKRIFILNQVHL